MNGITFSWKRTKSCLGDTLYTVTVYDKHGECIDQRVITKGYDSSYGRVMYNHLSAYRTTLKEIKEFAQEMFIQKHS